MFSTPLASGGMSAPSALGVKLRGRRDEEGERNILRQIRSGVGKPMLIDESANLFVRIARIRRSLKRLVDLLPNLLAHRVGGG